MPLNSKLRGCEYDNLLCNQRCVHRSGDLHYPEGIMNTPKPCDLRAFVKIIWPDPQRRAREISSLEIVKMMMIVRNREAFRNVRAN